MSSSYFTTVDGALFSPTDHTRGPWNVDACHAGPPLALMVRAVEALVPHQQLTRLTVELIRPIPMGGFRVQAEVRRPGRSVSHTEAEIYDEDRFYARVDPGSMVASGGPTTMWMRTLYPILPDEEPSPFQKISPLADCGNGISHNGDLLSTSFVNPDLTLSLHREPEGDWFASRSVSHWQASGIGLADSELFDVDGPVGRATQGLILSENPSASATSRSPS